jgi:hypothetical protein
VKYLVEGWHGPVEDPNESLRLAQEVRRFVVENTADSVMEHAWNRIGGGRFLVVDLPDTNAVDAFLASCPGPPSQEWKVSQLGDLVETLNQYIDGSPQGTN